MATNAAEQPDEEEILVRIMTEGGDERIRLDPATGLNRYFSAPRPSGMLAYSSSTANDLSHAAMAHLAGLAPLFDPALYPERLDALRDRIRSAYRVPRCTHIVFAPSGTDLEYVVLAATPDAGCRPLMNVLLGANEVGSGCIHSAGGRYFADTTALGVPTRAGIPVGGMAGSDFTMVDIPIRDALGRPRAPDEIGQAIDGTVSVAHMSGQHVLAHAVHVSKTGLIVPGLDEMDRLNAKYGWRLSWVVDACQARIAPTTINAYLERGAIILLTGSKFIGGPPFSGFALVPEHLMAEAAPLPAGFGSLFRRGEWPLGWPGSAQLADGANPGLLMRLEAAVFELERYSKLETWQVRRIVRSFRAAVVRLADRLGVSEVGAGGAAMPAEADPRGESGTLVTLDLSTAARDADLTDAQRWHRCLVGEGIRLGQPVRFAMGTDGRWKPCLRISLSMPMIDERADMSTEQLDETFRSNFDRIGRTLATCIGRG